ncbi:MAG: hypothetical protein AAB793_01400 [Patescibacteria group bacterium]
MNLNAKELEKLRDIVKYLKVAIKARSFIGYRFITSPKNIRKEVLNTLKTVRQTAEVRQARDYLEDALGVKKSDTDSEAGDKKNTNGWRRYLIMTDKDNLAKNVLSPLERLIKWEPKEEELAEKKVAPEFRKKVSGKTLDEESEKAAEYGTKKKISGLWKIAAAVAAGIAVGYGIKRTAHFIKRKNAKK